MATNGFMATHAGAANHQAGLVVINNTTMKVASMRYI